MDRPNLAEDSEGVSMGHANEKQIVIFLSKFLFFTQ